MLKIKRCNADIEKLYGYKIKLYPTDNQKERLNILIDLYRYVYNWTISTIEEYYAFSDLLIPINDACSLFAKKRNAEGNEWLKAIPINTARHAIMSAYASYSMFFKKKSRHPKYKTKKNSKKYFKIRGERIYFRGDKVGFEGLGKRENIECGNHNYIPVGPDIKYYNCTVVFDGYDYWLCVCVEMIDPIIHNKTEEVIGIDLGLRQLATLSDGTVYKLPDISTYTKREKKLSRQINKNYRRRLEQANQAKTKLDEIPKSKNMLKANKALKKAKDRSKNIRHSYISNMTTEIVNKYPSTIVLEDLNVNSMLKNKYLAHDISESMFATIRRQLEYKCKNAGIQIVYADRFFPSSQICSGCGNRQRIGTKKEYICPICGLRIDRDLNAAINLRNLVQ